jgi:hypothetical protein
MKKMYSIARNVLLVACISLYPGLMMSQNTFLKVYPTNLDKEARDVLATSDGGYIIAGSTNTSIMNDCDVYVIKTDANGDTVWTKSYGGPKPDYAFSMLETSDGNFFIVGYSQSYSAGDFDIYLLKINPTGGVVWSKTYGTSTNEEGHEIIATADGNYAIVGSTEIVSTNPPGNMYLMKIDVNGTVIWTKYYGGPNKEYGNSVKQTPTGGYILLGQTYSYGTGNGDAYLVKTNSTGDTIWTKTYGGPLQEEGTSLVCNNDGSFAFLIRDSTSTRDIDTRVVKTDGNGTVIWDKIYGGTKKDTPKKIISTSDGGYFLGVTSRSFGWVNPDMWVLKLNAAGDSAWSRHYGGPNHEHCNAVRQTADGGYLAAGHTKSYGPNQSIMFLKLDSNGQLGAASVIELAMNTMFKIYPNPTAGTVNLEMENQPNTAIVKIKDAVGREIYSGSFEAGGSGLRERIDIGNNMPGIYFLSVWYEDRYSTQKIILK